MMTKKRVLAVLMAGLILVAATACNGNGGEEESSSGGSGLTLGTGLLDHESDTDDETGNDVINPGTPSGDHGINESNPTWTEKECVLLVVSKTEVNIREETSMSSKALTTVENGAELDATAYSENWYRVTTKEGITGYISKRMVVEFDQDLLDSFVACSGTVEIIYESVKVRRYPDWSNDKTDLVGGYLYEGDEVVCVAKTNNDDPDEGNWYKIQVKTTADGVVDAKGTETREYYISANPQYTKLTTTEADTTATETTTAQS